MKINKSLLLRAAIICIMISLSFNGFAQCHGGGSMGGGSMGGGHGSHNSSSMKSGNNSTSGLYVCPMHPEIQSEVPGTCPKCGMKLERTKNAASKESSKTTYYCKSHQDYESAHKGKCPTCGKKLKKRQEFTYQ